MHSRQRRRQAARSRRASWLPGTSAQVQAQTLFPEVEEEGEEADVDFEEMWGPQHVVHQAIATREKILKDQATRRKKKKEKEENETMSSASTAA